MLLSLWSPITEITANFVLDFDDNKKINSIDLSAMRDILKQLGILRS